jgi:hypothetical protein
VGARHLVGDPEPVAGRFVLCADGELSGASPHTGNIIPRQRDC